MVGRSWQRNDSPHRTRDRRILIAAFAALSVAGVLAACPLAYGAPVAIVNAGFENPQLAEEAMTGASMDKVGTGPPATTLAPGTPHQLQTDMFGAAKRKGTYHGI